MEANDGLDVVRNALMVATASVALPGFVAFIVNLMGLKQEWKQQWMVRLLGIISPSFLCSLLAASFGAYHVTVGKVLLTIACTWLFIVALVGVGVWIGMKGETRLRLRQSGPKQGRQKKPEGQTPHIKK